MRVDGVLGGQTKGEQIKTMCFESTSNTGGASRASA